MVARSVVARDVKVDDDHPLIGKYVVEVTSPGAYREACNSMRRMNVMVYERDGVDDRFKITNIAGDWLVVRKLLKGDLEEFISEDVRIIDAS
jgi:hypothetical protein